MVKDSDSVIVGFHPQVFREVGGDRHASVDACDRDPVAFAVPEDAGTDPDGNLLPDNCKAAQELHKHPNAPSWVRDWDGPFVVKTAWVDDGESAVLEWNRLEDG